MQLQVRMLNLSEGRTSAAQLSLSRSGRTRVRIDHLGSTRTVIFIGAAVIAIVRGQVGVFLFTAGCIPFHRFAADISFLLSCCTYRGDGPGKRGSALSE